VELSNKEKRRARKHAILMVYQYELSKASPEEVENSYWDDNKENENVKLMASKLFRGTLKNIKLIDIEIAKHLKKGWTIKRLLPIDRSILRVSVYEILNEKISPAGAIINDAVEIAKKYGEEKSPKFVNAILDRIAKEK
jgi:N utilization substance protein B